MSVVLANDIVALADEAGRRYLLRVAPGVIRVQGIGVIDPGKLEGLSYGAPHTHGSKTFRILKPGYGDVARGIARKAQVILPKDQARILYECDVRAGRRVVEAGIGSGALTSALAGAVAPMGRVFTYEIREDFAQWGRDNLERAGLSDFVEVKVADVADGIAERDVDAVILDMPDPWRAVPAAAAALRGDGHFCAYSPLVSQVEQTRAALEAAGFMEIRTLELIEREWVVGDRGSRPSFDMLGHTGFLTLARHALP